MDKEIKVGISPMVDNDIRVLRVLSIWRAQRAWCWIYAGLFLLALGLALLVQQYRPDAAWFWAFPIVYGLWAGWKWFTWSNV